MSLTMNSNLENNDFVEVLPVGEIDIYTSPVFKNEMLNIIASYKKNLVINAKNLEYLDSTGLGALMSILKSTKENNLEITIKNLKPNIYKLFEITNLSKIFNIEV